MITGDEREALEQIAKAVRDHSLYVAEMIDANTGARVAAIGMGRPHGDEGDLEFFPLARMLSGEDLVQQ